MIAVDGAQHARYRKLVTGAFTARRVAALRARTEQIATELLDDLAARGPRVDLVTEYADLLPATVIAEVLGAPVEMRGQFLEWGAGAAVSMDTGLRLRQFRSTERDLEALAGWLRGHFSRIRRTPGDDVLSELVAARDEGRLTDDELTSTALLLLVAGFETTVNLIGNGVALLLAHPDQLALLRAEPHRWGRAVEEILRFDPPAASTARVALRDTAGERFRAGTIVVIWIGGANLDPAVFPDPHTFDVTRENAGEHLSFSSGPLLRGCGACADGGRGCAAGAVRALPRCGTRRTAAPAPDTRAARLRRNAGNAADRTRRRLTRAARRGAGSGRPSGRMLTERAPRRVPGRAGWLSPPGRRSGRAARTGRGGPAPRPGAAGSGPSSGARTGSLRCG